MSEGGECIGVLWRQPGRAKKRFNHHTMQQHILLMLTTDLNSLSYSFVFSFFPTLPSSSLPPPDLHPTPSLPPSLPLVFSKQVANKGGIGRKGGREGGREGGDILLRLRQQQPPS